MKDKRILANGASPRDNLKEKIERNEKKKEYKRCKKTNEQLVTLIKSGIDTADNMLQLWEQNKGFIWKIADSYKGYEETEDLMQQGYIGLCNAVEGYRPEEKVLFISYAAFWIRQSMKRYIENYGSIVRIPTHEWQRQRKYKKFLHEFESQVGRKPTEWETCHCMQICRKVLAEMKNNAGMERIGSLDSRIDEEGDTTVGELVPGDADVEGSVLDGIEHEEFKAMLWALVDNLSDNQPCIIRSIYQEGKTLAAAGDVIGVSKERVRIIRDNALRKLRNVHGRKIIAFVPESIESLAYRHNGYEEFNRT